MKVCILREPGQIEIIEKPVPEPSEGELVVKIGAALTCGTDLKAFQRGHPMIPMPGVFGHEFSGIVAAAGKNAGTFREGDPVMAVHSAPCGICGYCRRDLGNLCVNIMNTKILGAFSEYIRIPAHIVKINTFPMHPGLPFEEAALLEPLSCVVHGIQGIPVRDGTTAVIIGAGPIGLLHLVLLKASGARVLVCDRGQERRLLASEAGADRTTSPEELHEAVQSFTEGMGADLVFECTGRPEVWQDAIRHVRRGGTVILFGGCPKGTTVTYDTFRVHYDEITLRGVFHFTPRDVKKAYDLLGNSLPVSFMISGRHRIEELPSVLVRLSRGEGVKYAIIP